MGHAQASTICIVSGTRRYLCRQRNTHIGIRHQPPCATQRTHSKKEDSCHAPAVSDMESWNSADPPCATTETQPERRFWPRTSRVTQGGLGGKFCWLSEPRVLLERTLHGKCTTAHAEDMRHASTRRFTDESWRSVCTLRTIWSKTFLGSGWKCQPQIQNLSMKALSTS